MKRILTIVFLVGFSLSMGLRASAPTQTTPPDDFCGIRNYAFQPGEQLSFTIYYSIIGIYVNAGNATVTTSLERMNNRPVYYVVSAGKSNTSYDWISK
ncbi:MAG TPA: DUF3108 domain-containing protein, partial [Flavisolibacter sp.]|nr:DUF3108 domain-containing protein [Flavisolibacter sp.]